MGAEVRGGGTKKDGFMSVARPVGGLSGVSRDRGARDVSGRAVVVGDIMEDIDTAENVGEAGILVRDCTE
jgi:histidinol phosphatase-like enzyme